MPRPVRLFLNDMLTAMEKVQSYTKDMTYDEFVATPVVFDAVIRNLEIIGEAARNVVTQGEDTADIPWKNIVGLRNILIHEYFGIDPDIIWQIVTRNIPDTIDLVRETIAKLPK